MHEEAGFLIVPDMKWDLTTLSALYLVALVHEDAASTPLRSLRDLTRAHVPLLRAIRLAAEQAVVARWGVPHGGLRMFVHYQPSYCALRAVLCPIAPQLTTRTDHFHVHIVNANYAGTAGQSVGQAHLLDDIISLVRNFCRVSLCGSLTACVQLELDAPDSPSIFSRMTLTYNLGEQHPLFKPMTAAQTHDL